MANRPLLYLIDGSSYIYRAFFGLPSLKTSRGFPTNAIYGFITMLIKILKEKRPDYLAIAFDPKGPTKRSAVYQEYKSHRPPMPEELIPQIPYIHQVVEAFQIPVLLEPGYEADDLIGTYARIGSETDLEVVIVTGDKDMLQLVSPDVSIYDPMKDKKIGREEVSARFGVGPEKVIEIMGLMGDSSDNIPGVRGIGEKTAIRLIQEYGTIDHLIDSLDRMKPSKLKENLAAEADIARLSRDLATIDLHAPAPVKVEAFKVKESDMEKIRKLFTELEFHSLLKALEMKKSTRVDFKLMDSPEEADRFILKVNASGGLLIEPFVSGTNPKEGALKGLALRSSSPLPESPVFVPADTPLFEKMKPVLEDARIKKSGHDLKKTFLLLKNLGISLNGLYFDTMIASYLIHPGNHQHSLEEIVLEHLHLERTPDQDLTAKERQNGEARFSMNQAAASACESVDLIDKVRETLSSLLETYRLNELFYQLEMPLVPVLAEIEHAGIKLNLPLLEDISKELEQQLNVLMDRIYLLAGERFNINSPKQLSEILFERLKLKPVKKTKTGYSTDEGVLTRLALQHELPAEIVNYRQLAKLKSTYVDALPRLVNLKSGRLHTSLNQTVTVTGRLSSSDPNLQNIPARGEWGKRIREAFIADKGWLLLSADYSQIELRILAHMSQDRNLIQSFQEGGDIHRKTAAQIFKISPDRVSKEMRQAAKSINFGIIYGMGAFSLADDLGISQREAKQYIENYFSCYRGVRDFIDKTIAEAKTNGFVTTLLNRRRVIPELQSSNPAIRSFGERTAINTPIQGSAADLIKMAMVSIAKKIAGKEEEIKMILQIHDELLFEVSEPAMEESKKMIKHEMEQVVRLSVPITVDIGTGKNWSEAH
ncbi:MAG: DNA polymerase I [Nitrospirae bacterium]|nr:DNA polymerase I [Nitrospirota bacterium]